MEYVDRVADIEPLSSPTRSSGPRVHHGPGPIVLRSDIAHRVRRYPPRRRHIRHDATIRSAEAKLTIGLSIDLIALLVNSPVVAAAEQDEVRQRGGAALGPVADVVGLAETPVAAREAAAAVPMEQRSPQRWRDRAGLGADLEDATLGIMLHDHLARVASKALRRSAETRAPSSAETSAA
jgi:hypothetical protein